MDSGWLRRKHAEEVKRQPDYPAHIRQFLLANALYILGAMPQDVREQRETAVRHDDGVHPETGNISNYRHAEFSHAVSPKLPGFSFLAKFKVGVTHDVEKPPEMYIKSEVSPSPISLGVELSEKLLAADDTKHKPHRYDAGLQLEKFWCDVMREAGLKESAHNTVSSDEFCANGYAQGDKYFRGIHFHPRNYALVERTLDRLLQQAKEQSLAASRSDELEEIFGRLGFSPAELGAHSRHL